MSSPRRAWRRPALVAATALAAALLAGCAGPVEPVYPPDPNAPEAAPLEYAPDLEPAAAVLALVPQDAAVLRVTDLERLRLELGATDLVGTAPAPERDAFWRDVAARTAALTTGLLRPVDATLADEYGFTEDDLVWEATFADDAGTALGWVVGLREGLALDGVARAVADGVGPLAGATLDEENRLLTQGAAEDGEDSWAVVEGVGELVGAPATSTFVSRSCVPFDQAIGPGLLEELAEAPALAVDRLDDLGPWSVAFGSEVATVRLGTARDDAFERLRLGEVLPETDPAFARGFADGAADPGNGRLGYALGAPAVAAGLAQEGRVPFALCANED